MRKPRYAIKHTPTGKFYYEDEGGAYLVDENDSFITYGSKEEAEEMFIHFKTQESVWVEDFNDPVSISEFELAEL